MATFYYVINRNKADIHQVEIENDPGFEANNAVDVMAEWDKIAFDLAKQWFSEHNSQEHGFYLSVYASSDLADNSIRSDIGVDIVIEKTLQLVASAR